MNWKLFAFNAGIRNDVFNIKNIKASQIDGDYDFEQLTNDFISLYVNAGADTFNDGYFPTRGFSAGLSYSWVFAGFPNRFNNFHECQPMAKVVVPGGDFFAFIPSFHFRFLLGSEIPVAYFNAIGGSLASRYMDQQIPFIGITNVTATKNILTTFRNKSRLRPAGCQSLTCCLLSARV